MRPETLPLVSDFKKEYKFLWYISADITGASGTYSKMVTDVSGHHYKFPELSEGSILYNAVVANPLFSGYISQLAETVTLPDDEFDTESIPQGPVDYDMPKRVKLEDINVTYLEDSLETVYNFHKAWFQAIRCGKGIGINSPSLFSATARYIPFEDTMTAEEYIVFKNQIVQKVNSFISSDFANPGLPLGAKPTSLTTYPRIWPKKIHRSAANHGGEDIATVEVTYSRIPVFEEKHTPLQIWNGITWNNTTLNPLNL
jgi:hypothetical protein